MAKCPVCHHEVDGCYVCDKVEHLTPHKYKDTVIYLCNHHENVLQKLIKPRVDAIIEDSIDSI